ncbi:MAG: putative M18 family aminopeptidase 2 [Chlamydiae bacterium]|nr:putative M18 family aminopeptidase 2 [Chlamydiota bacterium]
MTHLLEDLTHFLSQSPTSWHAAMEMGNRLASLDFTPLSPNEKWELEKGKKYFVIQDGSIAAFALPSKKPQKMSLIAAHTDSPALKLKPKPVLEKENMQMLGVEIYGSPVLPTWVNRDLAIAGRVVVLRKNNAIEEELVFFDDAPVLIPLLAPHLDREAYKKGLELNKQEHLTPIATLKDKNFDQNYLESLLKRQLSFHKLLDFELFLIPLDHPRFIGKDGEMLASYRLDNLASAHAGLVAMGHLEKAPSGYLPIGIFWDHEEVGSATHTGAESPFFHDLLKHLSSFYKLSGEEETLLRRHSLCLSVDLTHAYNPNYEKKYDPQHIPLLGEGITIKYNANMRYSTTAKSGAWIRVMCESLGLKSQQFVNRTDNPAGSTVGPIFSTNFGIETADIGIPQLSMHAAREVIACQDHIDMCTLLTYFLQEKV